MRGHAPRGRPDAQAQVWTVVWPVATWARRAAHDLVIHRADAAGAVGAAYTVAPDLAADALDEFLDLMGPPPGRRGGGRRRRPRSRRDRPPPRHRHRPRGGVRVAHRAGLPGFTWRPYDEHGGGGPRPIKDVLRVAYAACPRT